MTEGPTPRTPYLGRFTLALLIVFAIVVVLRIVMAQVFGYVLSPGATAIVPAIGAALHVGQVWGRDLGAVPPTRAMWRFAVVGALINLAVRLPFALLALVGAAGGGSAVGIVLGMELALALVAVLVIRFMLATGAKGEVKAASRG